MCSGGRGRAAPPRTPQHDSRASGPPPCSAITPLSRGAIAIVRTLLAGGTLATRLMVAGTLLLVGLPVLTILVYVWGYPWSPGPLPLVVLVDGLQVLIVLSAIVVVAQLVAGTRIRARRVPSRHRETVETRETPLPPQRNGPTGLREFSLRLAEMIWEQERKNSAVVGAAVLDCVREAVTAELEHRRRMHVLEQRLANLEVSLTGGSGTDASDYERR